MKFLTAFYDLVNGPVSYDFVTWLVRARFTAEQRGLDGLHVVIVPKEDGLGGFARHWGEHDEAATRWRLQYIVVASCPLMRATVTVAPTRDMAIRIRQSEDETWWAEGKAHFMGPLVLAARAGHSIPKLRATDQARAYVKTWLSAIQKPVATLTQRDQSTDPARNTKTNEWAKLADWLVTEGYRVVTLWDSHVELAAGHGYATLSPDLRLALYEQSEINVIGNNGPQELLKFSDARYAAFGQALSKGWQEHFKRYFSMNVGDQLPWAGSNQRLVYEPDNFDVMQRVLKSGLGTKF